MNVKQCKILHKVKCAIIVIIYQSQLVFPVHGYLSFYNKCTITISLVSLKTFPTDFTTDGKLLTLQSLRSSTYMYLVLK